MFFRANWALQTQLPCDVNPLATQEYYVADLRVVKEEVPTKQEVGHFLNGQFVFTEQACKFYHDGFTYYACPICQQTFMLYSDLKTHSLIHLNDVRIPSGSLKPSLGNTNGIIQTVQTEHENKNGYNPSPTFELTKQVNEVIDGGKNLYPCLICSKIYPSLSKLQRHALIHVVGGKKHKCAVCQKGFDKYNQLRNHRYNQHVTEKDFKCNFCEKAFKFNRYLKQHVKIHQQKEFKCDLCDYRGRDMCCVRSHKEEDHKATQDIDWVCETCGEGFKTYRRLTLHKYKKHTQPSIKCPDCGKMFLNKSRLRFHSEIHKPNKQRTFICETCGASFCTDDGLKCHQKRIHSSKKSSKLYKCMICNKSVTSASYLAIHHRIHTGEKPFSCDVCKKEFSTTKYLTVHKRIHTGEKPYSCKECGKSFTQQGTLSIHMRSHTGIKPYTCEICSKSFVTKTLLTAHVKTHNRP